MLRYLRPKRTERSVCCLFSPETSRTHIANHPRPGSIRRIHDSRRRDTARTPRPRPPCEPPRVRITTGPSTRNHRELAPASTTRLRRTAHSSRDTLFRLPLISPPVRIYIPLLLLLRSRLVRSAPTTRRGAGSLVSLTSHPNACARTGSRSGARRFSPHKAAPPPAHSFREDLLKSSRRIISAKKKKNIYPNRRFPELPASDTSLSNSTRPRRMNARARTEPMIPSPSGYAFSHPRRPAPQPGRVPDDGPYHAGTCPLALGERREVTHPSPPHTRDPRDPHRVHQPRTAAPARPERKARTLANGFQTLLVGAPDTIDRHSQTRPTREDPGHQGTPTTHRGRPAREPHTSGSLRADPPR